ncbi:GNAT family N-acetyltransferase [Flavobacterium sp. RSSA_27]|uniref:GNAT family N-acetyltransferase n=1 Tax=Flavobacterium sp. RSSA_27 TaxID=3447667 RepID=UPI003F323A6B
MDLLLETDRLMLRPFTLDDAEAMFIMDSNPIVHKYLWNKPVQDITEIYPVIESLQKQYTTNKIGRFATFLKKDGQFIGWTGIKFINDQIENGNTNFYDYGYRLDERFWNKGYATEATKFWLDYGFNQMQIQEMNAYTHAQNGASNHILSKCGMQFVEEYTAEDGINWKWWQLLNPNHK